MIHILHTTYFDHLIILISWAASLGLSVGHCESVMSDELDSPTYRTSILYSSPCIMYVLCTLYSTLHSTLCSTLCSTRYLNDGKYHVHPHGQDHALASELLWLSLRPRHADSRRTIDRPWFNGAMVQLSICPTFLLLPLPPVPPLLSLPSLPPLLSCPALRLSWSLKTTRGSGLGTGYFSNCLGCVGRPGTCASGSVPALVAWFASFGCKARLAFF